MRKIIRYVYVSVVFLLLFSVVSIGVYIEYQRVISREQKALEDDVRIVKSNIQQMITSRMINAKGLSGILELADDMSYEEYQRFAKGIYDSEDDVVKDVVLITDTTISYVYPEIYQEDAIGVDLAQIEEQRDVLLYSKETGKSVFIGPIELVEGGLGLVIRVPFDLNGQYYGQAAIVFDYEAFVEKSGLVELSNKNYILLSGNDPVSNVEQLIWNNSNEPLSDAITEYINLDTISWTLKVSPKEGWNGVSTLLIFILFFGFIVTALISLLFMRQIRLKDQLLSSNTSLNESVNQLEENRNELEIHLKEIKEKEAYIRYLAEHDALTGLRNRRFFSKRIEEELENKNSGTIILLDLDNFKHVNDIHGHIYGDKLLKSCANIISEGNKSNQKAYRFGGDEFLILITGDVEKSEVEDYLEFISNRIEGQTVEGSMQHITMSAGIVQYPKDGATVEELLMKVDVAMYNAKYSGKNCYVFFTEEIFNDFNVRIDIENVLREAQNENGFAVFYQPIVDTVTGDIVSFEALVRLKSFKHNPGDFIPIAEETGLIINIGYWIIEEVIGQLRQWIDSGYDVKPVAVNLSAKQLLDKRFVDRFVELMNAYDMPMTYIHFEITESVLLENEEDNISALNILHDKGIKISMDDFGTGYSSLNYLTYLPIDRLKLDKSMKDKFVHYENPQVLTGIISMSHGLSIEVVAEGVEDEVEWKKLQATGCDYLQGYLFSRPVPAEDIIRIMNKKFKAES